MTKSINPQEYSYAFRLGKYDCFKVRTGICSLDLTDEQYQEIKKREKNLRFSDGSVDYCRLLAAHMIKEDWFNKNTRINAYLYNCGHVAFGDGQHRTCIAKKLGKEKLVLNVFETNDMICRVCHFKKVDNNKSFMEKLMDIIKNRKRKDPATYEFIDDELTSFNTKYFFKR
ncbi:hypothetical protein P4K66_15295 [Bacillus anthracis]|uniref:hypothetical protein n=1 Tax=Bacillus cereus group TaxID=86661 RepID=UPI002DBC4A01|nr:hypothetical protein [Bacillus anthracis]MEC0017831.1 hypothetical protein [Bacillus anthracis]